MSDNESYSEVDVDEIHRELVIGYIDDDPNLKEELDDYDTN